MAQDVCRNSQLQNPGWESPMEDNAHSIITCMPSPIDGRMWQATVDGVMSRSDLTTNTLDLRSAACLYFPTGNGPGVVNTSLCLGSCPACNLSL